VSEAPAYVVAHVHEALSDDAAVADPGIEVTVVGERLFLNGTVMTAQQRDAASAVARRVAPEFEICNDLEVLSNDPAHGDAEHLS
jgi:hypothetical protein